MPGPAQRDHVADCRDAANARAILRVHLDVSLLELQPRTLGLEAGRHRAAARRHEQVVDAQRPLAAVGQLRLEVDAVRIRFRARHLRAGVRRDALLAKRFFELGRHGVVLDRDQPRQQLEERHLAAEPSED